MKHLLKIKLFIILMFILSGCSNRETLRIIKNGKTEYTIYLDQSVTESVTKAAEDLKSYFIKVTGTSPEIVVAARPPDGPYISLGNTVVAKAAGLDISNIPD